MKNDFGKISKNTLFPILVSQQMQVLHPITNSTLLNFFYGTLYCFLHSIK